MKIHSFKQNNIAADSTGTGSVDSEKEKSDKVQNCNLNVTHGIQLRRKTISR